MAKPVGIVDSGLGGLAIARSIWQLLPHETTVYLADHAFFPYGNKSETVINQRLGKIVDWFLAKNCQMVVIACNTITAAAIDRLRRQYTLPFVGTEPTVKQGGVVLATPTTAASSRYRKLAQKYPVTTIACPGLAEAIERGRNIKPFLPALPDGTKTVALGCTHYILVKDKLKKFYGRGVKIIDPSAAIARQVVKVLPRPNIGKREFFTSADADKATARASLLLGQRIIFKRCSL